MRNKLFTKLFTILFTALHFRLLSACLPAMHFQSRLCLRSPHTGASAPAKVLFEKFGFTAENVAATAKRVLGK